MKAEDSFELSVCLVGSILNFGWLTATMLSYGDHGDSAVKSRVSST